MQAPRFSPLAALSAFALFVAAPAEAVQPALQQRVEASLDEAVPGTRFGLMVTTEDGRELVAVNADDRFIPASNTKMLTTAAVFATMAGLDQPDARGGASVRLEQHGPRVADVILTGRGDARLSSAPDCVTNCLAALADAVAARTRRVRHVVGDDTLFPDQRWSPGMSWNNIQSRYGTAISALTIDDNELVMRVTPGRPGERPAVELPYYELVNAATTAAEGETELRFHRMPNSRTVRLTGTIVAGAEPETLRLGIDDPAHFAAWRLRTLLEARGVRITGEVQARHRPFAPEADDPAKRTGGPAPRPGEPEALARLTPPPLAGDLTHVNKVSQNLHSELLIRRLGLNAGSGSIEDGVAAIAGMMAQAGVPRTAWDLSDGSGMSTYNRLSPRSIASLLRWAAAQPWGAAWRETFPVAGVDGTLARRFRGTPLEGRLFAKTGTLNATNALSGYLTARSGRTLIFSFYANDVPGDAGATEHMDRTLALIAAEN
ncbi:D-alanyl-D-alanine carboxypeptidase/D-alanyl-D-alanine endopeptidase [Sphingosinicella terrae]|uniref:D-alanyl-D-alanine carboxypeptidase/D-alanyl-D-alanine endopeptidase n=1 Tax=Sphingosinicella terrae TaxID=2172047 RepID=UPI000E0D0A0D|nr:D-alanyl-D-alanine carboxypeptidase/D-alanyl-D-alanine-endopeptidase [Sphingosinicella terrae]